MRLRLALLAALLAAAATAQAARAAEPSPALNQVIKDAQKEGRLDLSWLPSFFGADGVAELVKGMNATFGTNLAYSFTPDPGSVPRNLNKILVAAQAHQPSPSDVFIGTTNHVLIMEKRQAARLCFSVGY